MEKAYKLLAVQENISNSQAKQLIDDGLVFVAGKQIKIARADVNPKSRFVVSYVEKIEKIFEDDKIIAVNKPSSVVSESLEKKFNAKLLHRLDKGTSGVLVLVKDEEFRLKAIEEFRNQRVYKEYIAIVSGIISEEMVIDDPIKTSKDKKAKSIISPHGQSARTEIFPLEISGKRTKIKAVIATGRTHQIRVHLSHIAHPILGDTQYGGVSASRIMLHSNRIKIFHYDLTANEPEEFKKFFS